MRRWNHKVLRYNPAKGGTKCEEVIIKDKEGVKNEEDNPQITQITQIGNLFITIYFFICVICEICGQTIIFSCGQWKPCDYMMEMGVDYVIFSVEFRDSVFNFFPFDRLGILR